MEHQKKTERESYCQTIMTMLFSFFDVILKGTLCLLPNSHSPLFVVVPCKERESQNSVFRRAALSKNKSRHKPKKCLGQRSMKQ